LAGSWKKFARSSERRLTWDRDGRNLEDDPSCDFDTASRIDESLNSLELKEK